MTNEGAHLVEKGEGSPLISDRTTSRAGLPRLKDLNAVLERAGEGLLEVDVNPRPERLRCWLGVGSWGCADKHSIDVLDRQHFVPIPVRSRADLLRRAGCSMEHRVRNG